MFIQGKTGQRGAALVVALLIAAIVAIIATRVGNNYLLSYKRSVNTILGDQAILFLISAETIASQVLLADQPVSQQSNSGGANSGGGTTVQSFVDHYGEEWAKAYPPVPIGAGQVIPDPIVDLQGRFNLNALLADASAPGQGSRKASVNGAPTATQKVFIRLLQSFEAPQLSEAQARELTEAVVDWLDSDNNPKGFGGAESSFYQEQTPAYRAANTPMYDISELRLVKGMNAELYEALRPHVIALPQNEGALLNPKINVNTATDNVLRALGYRQGLEYQPLDAASVAAFRESFPSETGFQDVAAFAAHSSWNGATFDANLIAVETQYFLFSSRVDLGEISLPMRSVLQRELGQSAKDGKITIISRTIGAL